MTGTVRHPPPRRSATAPLELAELLRVEPLASADAVHVPDPGRLVHQVVLAETFERLGRTGPHALVVLHAEAATGGWSLAAGLHATWERNAAAVVVPRPAMSASSVILAQRLGIALLVIDADPVDTSLALAGQVSAPEAARALRVALCAERLADQTSIRGVLGVLNAELAPAPVALIVGSSVAAGRAAALQERPDHRQVRIEVNGAGGRPWAELVASVPGATRAAAGHVESLLGLARLPLLAAWAQARLQTSTQAVQERAAFQLLRRLAGDPDSDALPRSRVESPDVAAPSWASDLGWRVTGTNRAVWIGAAHGADTEPAPELTELVRSAWQRERPDWPIIADADGWVSWQNISAEAPTGDDPDGDHVDDTDTDDAAAMRKVIGAVGRVARRHGLVLGIGGAHAGIPGLMHSVEEARLAAHVARDGGPGTVQWFDEVGARATLAWLPRGQIAGVAELSLPDLMAARDRVSLVDTVLTVLDCGGSLSQASTRLGVHRNTVLARVARARELGLVVDDPDRRLAMHVLCYALATLWTTPARTMDT
ncbi:PucR family transcriptional regulator [Pseudonocardia sp. CA-142604]|uniref:PucR family transcriptional regulator n=1 Tax=Pseudonocardia sp. CA-142604 TaxID=3240024 RepID=UPI003D921A14